MRLNEISYNDASPIDGYGPGFFRVGGKVYNDALLLSGAGTRAWAGFEDAAQILSLASINDLRELSIRELEDKVTELKKELMESRFSLATSQIEDTSIFKKIKKQIAQANTVLTQKKREEMMKAENNE